MKFEDQMHTKKRMTRTFWTSLGSKLYEIDKGRDENIF